MSRFCSHRSERILSANNRFLLRAVRLTFWQSISANTNNGIQPVSRVWKPNLDIPRIVCSPEMKSKLNAVVCATTRMKFRSVLDAMFPVARIAVRSCTCVPVVCMTTRTTVAIGIRKPNLAGGADANESTAFLIRVCQIGTMVLSLKAKKEKIR